MAQRLGVDLEAIEPSGPEGNVTRADVERAAAGGAEIEPLRGVRRSMARNMASACSSSPST